MAGNRFKAMGQNMYSSKSKDRTDPKTTNEEHIDAKTIENNNLTSQKDPESISGVNVGENIPVSFTDDNANPAQTTVDTAPKKKTAKKITKPSSTGKRGRKKGTVIVEEEKRKKTISISVSPEDEALYKDILRLHSKRFVSMSQLVGLALEHYINDQKLMSPESTDKK